MTPKNLPTPREALGLLLLIAASWALAILFVYLLWKEIGRGVV